MTPLIIDENFKEKIKNLVTYAESHPFSEEEFFDVLKGVKSPAGDRENHYFIDGFGTKIVYSIELQPHNKVRHLSVSITKDEAFPNPVIVEEIMKLVGFQNSLERCKIHIEKFDFNPKRGAVNILEVIKP